MKCAAEPSGTKSAAARLGMNARAEAARAKKAFMVVRFVGECEMT